jgi:GNAT superfamily N-acetyltransferase
VDGLARDRDRDRRTGGWLPERDRGRRPDRRCQQPAAPHLDDRVRRRAAAPWGGGRGGAQLIRHLLVPAWRFVAGLARPSARANRRRLAARGESLASLRIREAGVADIPALAELLVTTWNATYAPFLAKGPSREVRERQWRQQFAERDDLWFCLVVERPDGALVGFAQANRSDNPEYEGELRRIHLLHDYQRLGLGSRLVGHVARRFLSCGVRSMWLYGDARNPSIAAWLALGARKTDADPGNGNYGWRDIGSLAALPE